MGWIFSTVSLSLFKLNKSLKLEFFLWRLNESQQYKNIWNKILLNKVKFSTRHSSFLLSFTGILGQLWAVAIDARCGDRWRTTRDTWQHRVLWEYGGYTTRRVDWSQRFAFFLFIAIRLLLWCFPQIVSNALYVDLIWTCFSSFLQPKSSFFHVQTSWIFF